jgi:hypothetical protein
MGVLLTMLRLNISCMNLERLRILAFWIFDERVCIGVEELGPTRSSGSDT